MVVISVLRLLCEILALKNVLVKDGGQITQAWIDIDPTRLARYIPILNNDDFIYRGGGVPRVLLLVRDEVIPAERGEAVTVESRPY